MKGKVVAGAAVALMLIMGCVQIPDTFEARIYIDIRHIEEQADQALDYIEGKTDTLPEFDIEPTEKSSLLLDVVDFFAPVRVAYAQELKEGSPRAKQILDKMKARFSEVESVKKTGAVGENNRGLLEMVKPELITDDEARNAAQRVVAAENEDRKAYYQEIARINQEQNLKVGTVEQVYAYKRLERSKPGELFQLPPAGDYFEQFKKTPQGQRLGADAKPEAWVIIK